MMKETLRKNRILFLLTICTAVALSTYSAAASVADGVYAYEKGDYQLARSEWLPYAALGNPNALYNLGQLYRMGRGVKTDYAKAREYYLRAAEKGHIGAQRNLGTLYYFGRIGKVDKKQALKWLTKAAIGGDARSQLMVGIMQFNGITGQKNYPLAYAWIMLAAQDGITKAKSALSKLAGVMTMEQLAKAKKISPGLITRQLTPDDIGLMIKPPETTARNIPDMNKITARKTTAKVNNLLEKHPIKAPIPAIMTADNFRVQLGSYRSREIADKALKLLKKKLSDMIRGYQETIEFADLGKRGIYYRLQLGPFATRQNAAGFCSRLKTQGQQCYVVKAS